MKWISFFTFYVCSQFYKKWLHYHVCHFISPYWTFWLNGTGFCEIVCWGLLWKYVEKIQVWLKSDKNIGHFTWRPKDMIDNILRNSFWKERVSDKCCRDNQNTHFVSNMYSHKNCTLYKIIIKKKYVIKLNMAQNICDFHGR